MSEKMKTEENKLDEIYNLIQRLEQFNETSNESVVNELTHIASLVMDLGSALTPLLNEYFGQNTMADIHKLNLLIDSINVKKIKLIYAAGTLRYTYSHREELSQWRKLRNEVCQEAGIQKIDVNDMLYGLLD